MPAASCAMLRQMVRACARAARYAMPAAGVLACYGCALKLKQRYGVVAEGE